MRGTERRQVEAAYNLRLLDCKATLRRLLERHGRIVPPSRRDPALKTRLCSDPECQRAILAWAVEAALRWQETGLEVPARISKATADYREEQNPLRDFIVDCCVIEPDATCEAAALRRAYQVWCERTGNAVAGARRMAATLTAAGFRQERNNTARLWKGLRLKGMTHG